MESIQDYLDAAKSRGNLSADWKLAILLGVSPQWAAGVRIGTNLPSDTVMLKLADLAGVPPERALLDLNLWRAKSPSVAKVYAGIIQRLGAASIACALLLASSGYGHARTLAEQSYRIHANSVYYHKSAHYLLCIFLFLIRFVKDIHLQCGGFRIECATCSRTRFSDA